MIFDQINELLGEKGQDLLKFSTPKISKDGLTLPHPGYLDEVFNESDRSEEVKNNLKRMFGHGRLANTGYLSILPVDQGIEHTAGFSFVNNPEYFDPKNILKLAIEGGCNAVASSMGVLSLVAAHSQEIPFIVKLNHNELLTQPDQHKQVMFATVDEAKKLGAAGVGATIYFGSTDSHEELEAVRDAFAAAHSLGMFTVLWCYVRNEEHFVKNGVDYQTAADLTGQANHLGVSLGADIIKQKLPDNKKAFKDLNFAKWTDEMYEELIGEHPIDLTRYQVLNCYEGRIGLISSGGASGDNDFADALAAAIINKRAGGMGLIVGRKAFNRPMDEGVKLLHLIQDVYLEKEITIA